MSYFFILECLMYCIAIVTIAGISFTTYLLWFQPAFYFPKPKGNYSVGGKVYHWTDTARTEPYAHDSTHPFRELMVKIWYPTDGKLPEKPTTPWAPDVVDYLKKNQKLLWLFMGSRPIYSYAQPDAPLSTGSSQFPVIIFSHGRGSFWEGSNTAHCEELASHGFIVVGINHPYGSILTTFPDGRIIDGMTAIKQRTTGSTFTEIKNKLDEELEVLIADVQCVLDQLEQLDDNQKSPFYQRLDKEHIGIFGHSIGGAAALQVCRRDARVKAGVDLDGPLFGLQTTTSFDKPFMFMLSEANVKVAETPLPQGLRNNFKISCPEEERAYKYLVYLSALELAQSVGHDVYLLSFQNFGHLDFSFGAQLKHASLLLRLLGNLVPKSMIGSIDGSRATEIVNSYLLGFFNKYLKGQPSELLDGTRTTYEEVKDAGYTNK